MNYRLLSKLLGIVAFLIGGTMVFSLPWAHPALGTRHLPELEGRDVFETEGFYALLGSIAICLAVGAVLMLFGRGSRGRLFRKEALAVVGLSWILATVLGALPFYLSGSHRCGSVRLVSRDHAPLVYDFQGIVWRHWKLKPELTPTQYTALSVLVDAGAKGLDESQLRENFLESHLESAADEVYFNAFMTDIEEHEQRQVLLEFYSKHVSDEHRDSDDVKQRIDRLLREAPEFGREDLTQKMKEDLLQLGPKHVDEATLRRITASLDRLRKEDAHWRHAIIFPGEDTLLPDRAGNFRIRWIKMGIADCLFESQSGFSTTGATVIADLEDPELVPHCVLFWRSSTHFLGGMGIIVLFVTILGHGAAGKALMRAEMPGPTKEGATARMQHTAWLFAATYAVLNLVLATILFLMGLTPFDALCHAFGTMATGGFSTYNASLGHFDSAIIDYTVIIFMVIAGTNFTLLYFLLIRQPQKMLGDTEWRVYIGVIIGVSLLVVLFGLLNGDFRGETPTEQLSNSVRFGSFQVVSIMTTTGYGTANFDGWNSFGRGVLFLLMFVGGCAGSTGGGLKVIRHVLFLKILWLEVEKAFHPSVVRPLRVGGKPVEDPDLRRNILVYFSIILAVFVFSWLFLITVEPDTTWGQQRHENKLIDSASGVAATLNNIGPGLDIVGATENYSYFSPLSKLLFLLLMMIGRLEIFAIVVLFVPSFWRSR